MAASALWKFWYRNVGPHPRGIVTSCDVQGDVAEIKIHYPWLSRPHGKRGEITDFSDRSRLAMITELLKVDYDSGPQPLFITLTYPDDRALPDHDTRNLHRKIMARHLEKLTGKHLPACWRVEWMDRKTGKLIGQYCPHWHLLVFGHRWIDCHEVNRLWKKTIDWTDHCQTETRCMIDEGGVRRYMSKYIAKEGAVSCSLVYATNQSKLGRAYGWLRKKEIPRHPLHRYAPTSDQAQALRDLASQVLFNLRPDLDSSYKLFGDVAKDVQKILDGVPLTGAGVS